MVKKIVTSAMSSSLQRRGFLKGAAALGVAGAFHWQSKTYQYLQTRLLPSGVADIADLGAGNCWLSYRLQQLSQGRQKRFCARNSIEINH